MEEGKAGRVAILVAVIGLVGTLGVALVENWSSLFAATTDPQSGGEDPQREPPATEESTHDESDRTRVRAPGVLELVSTTPSGRATLRAGQESVRVSLRYGLREPATLFVDPLTRSGARVPRIAWQAQGGGQTFGGRIGTRIRMELNSGPADIELDFKGMDPCRVDKLRLVVSRSGSRDVVADEQVQFAFVR